MVFVRIDKSGRILLPKKVRDEIGSESFSLEVEKEKLVLRRIKGIEEMRGSMPSLTFEVWKREHEKER